jgi:hypothetical protein
MIRTLMTTWKESTSKAGLRRAPTVFAALSSIAPNPAWPRRLAAAAAAPPWRAGLRFPENLIDFRIAAPPAAGPDGGPTRGAELK